MQRKIVFSEGEYYHAYNRGVEKRKIFLSNNDRRRFIRLLYLANSTKNFVYRDVEQRRLDEIDRGAQLVAIGAWVLMPNHFHILIKEITKGGTSLFMQKLLTGYSSYFNKRYTRVGGLFQGAFHARHADTDEYLKYLFAYIHLNPIKLVDSSWKEAGIADRKTTEHFLQEYKHSSYFDYLGVKREEGKIISREVFPEYFSDSFEFDTFISDWLTLRSIHR